MRRAPLATASLLLALLAACGGSRVSTRASTFLLPVEPTRFHVSDRAFQLDSFVAPNDGSLRLVTEALWRHLLDAGLTPFDPAAALAGSEVNGFAQYVTWQERFIDGDVHHVAFVVVDPWTEENTHNFVQFFGAMPAHTPARAGAPYFHIVSRYPVPQAARWLFSNQWYGSLESRLFSELETSEHDVAAVADLASRLRAILADWDLRLSDGEGVFSELDQLLALLPPPESETGWRPDGILLSFGVLLGEALRTEHNGVEWTDGSAALATLYALTVDGPETGLLRPLDFALHTWGAANPTPFAAYRELVESRIDELRPRR